MGLFHKLWISIFGSGASPFAYTKSLQLDGVDERITFPNSATIQVTNNMSLCCWMKSTATLSNAGLISKFSTSAGNDAYLISLNSAKPNFWITPDGSGTRKRYQIETTVNDGNWHMLAMTFSTNTLKVYLDGSEATPTKTQDNTVNSIYAGTLSLDIGHLRSAVWAFAGKVTGVTLWDTAVLSGANISALYNSGAGANPQTLSTSARLVWGIDFQQTGDDSTNSTGVIHDITTNNLDGTPVNTEAGDIVSDGPA